MAILAIESALDVAIMFGDKELAAIYTEALEEAGVPSEKFKMTGIPAKVLTQTRNDPDELICFGSPEFINTSKPVSMGPDDYQNFLMWKRENRD